MPSGPMQNSRSRMLRFGWNPYLWAKTCQYGFRVESLEFRVESLELRVESGALRVVGEGWNEVVCSTWG